MPANVNRTVELPLKEIGALCRKLGVAELALFGSVLRGDARPDSDVDLLVRFQPGAEMPWMGHFRVLEEALEQALGRQVDLVDRKAVEQSRNWRRRKSILDSARVLYAA